MFTLGIKPRGKLYDKKPAKIMLTYSSQLTANSPVTIMSQFRWTDDENEALLNVTLEYKVDKAAEGIDWESLATKYPDITRRLATHINEVMMIQGAGKWP
jgi:hypothetical protein